MPIHDIVNCSTSVLLNLESEKCKRKSKNYKNLNILRTKKAFSIKNKIKSIFYRDMYKKVSSNVDIAENTQKKSFLSFSGQSFIFPV